MLVKTLEHTDNKDAMYVRLTLSIYINEFIYIIYNTYNYNAIEVVNLFLSKIPSKIQIQVKQIIFFSFTFAYSKVL